jgi:hypothetical protein
MGHGRHGMKTPPVPSVTVSVPSVIQNFALRRVLITFVNQVIVLGVLRAHEEVSVGVALDALQGLAPCAPQGFC